LLHVLNAANLLHPESQQSINAEAAESQNQHQRAADLLGTSVVKDLDPLLAWHMGILRLLAMSTQAADQACLLLLARAAMPKQRRVVGCLYSHTPFSFLSSTVHHSACSRRRYQHRLLTQHTACGESSIGKLAA